MHTTQVTIEEAAARRGCSASTIVRRIRTGELHVKRVLGRLVARVDEVDALEIPARSKRLAGMRQERSAR